jgi:hypothetical protein
MAVPGQPCDDRLSGRNRPHRPGCAWHRGNGVAKRQNDDGGQNDEAFHDDIPPVF